MRAPALLSTLFLATTACSSGSGVVAALDSRQNAGPCPTAGALYDAARIVKFDEADAGRYTNITYTGEITGVRLFCRYVGGNPLNAEIEIDFAFGKGPAADARQHTYEYFVAVTRTDSRVLEKQVFSVDTDFGTGTLSAESELVGRITIPRRDETISGINFEVLVGFELTDEQRTFNQNGQRFRLDAAGE